MFNLLAQDSDAVGRVISFLGTLRTAQGFFYVAGVSGQLSDGPGMQTSEAFAAAQQWRRQQEHTNRSAMQSDANETDPANEIMRYSQAQIEQMGPELARAIAQAGKGKGKPAPAPPAPTGTPHLFDITRHID